MKNLYKLLAIIALIAVIGFAFTTCEQPAETSTLTGITADYTGGSVAINTDVNSLKSSLTVTAKYSDNTSKILNDADYSLSGDLSSSGQKTVTVSYEGKTTTFNVTVTAAANNDITYTAAQTGGADGTTDSTGIVFTFSASVDSLNLSAADITVSGAAAKDAEATLTGTGTSLTLAPITVNAAGLATVAIAKEGIEAVQKSVTIYKAGAYVPEYWSITWHLNGGAEGTGAYPTQIEKGTVLDRPSPDPSKDGSTFGGWYADSGLTQPYAFANPVTADLNLYAKWVVIGIAPTITTTTLPNGAVGTPYSQTLAATGEAPITWIKESGELPGGLDIASDTGVIFGTPTTAGTFNFTVTATNAAGSHQSTQLSITITPGGTSRDDAIPLTENIWADGNIATAGGQQWFVFTATAVTQYIHVSFGTLTDLYVQVYDNSGTTTVGSETQLYNVTTNISRSLTTGQKYYIRVRPYSSSYTGTYRIGFNTTTTTPNIQLPSNAIPLTENIWADGNLPTSSSQQWFTFTATASPQYIHAAFSGTLSGDDGIYVQVYDTSGAMVGSEAELYGTGARTSQTLTVGQTYYIRVSPCYNDSSGTYLIAFNTSTTLPPVQLPTNAIPLTENQWADGNLPTSSSQEWFTFTATASIQYIHAAFGTLNGQLGGIYVQVYDSSGTTSGSETRLNNSTKYTSRTLTTEQTYYIRVSPYSSNYSGTYRIGFNTSTISPPNAVQLPTNAITLTANTWADGSLPTSTDVQWFTFTATATTQYIHFDPGTLTYMYVQVYDSNGAAVGSEPYFSSSTTNISRSLTSGQTYYIRVRPYSTLYTGTYRIGFTASTTAPNRVQIPSNAIQLTVNQWADGNIATEGGQQWFTFTATASPQYIHAAFGTLSDLYVQVYDSSGAAVGAQTRLYSTTTNISRSLTNGQTYYIRVSPSYSYSGSYWIGFNTSTTPPPVQLPTNAITLTANTWADGNLPTSSNQQWFVFTATASTQYIHVDFGTLTDLYVQVYDSSSATVGAQTRLYSTTTNISRSLTNGQTYYIRVRPSRSTDSGTYRIGFNTTFYPPGTTPLTENLFADGNLPTSSSQQWFSFTATAATQYIHVSLGTLTYLYARVYDSSGTEVGSETTFYSYNDTYTSRSLTDGQTYYIRVRPSRSTDSGTYRIGFNTSTTAPFDQWPPDAIPLTENQWANGSVPSSGDRQQWFSFTATANTQYIHVSTTIALTVQVYDSSIAAVGSGANFYGSANNTSRTLTSELTYYIRVTPNIGSGTYRIAFNTSTTAPQ